MQKNITKNSTLSDTDPDVLHAGMQRRSFLRYAGAGAAGLSLLAAACKKSDGGSGTVITTSTTTKTTVDVGKGDTGILNYAYALEQLEAAFYTQVIATPYTGITASETAILTDIRDHEIAHREFFKTTLGANAIAAITPDFSSINFADKTNVLTAAKGFEDLGVAAYNGVAYLITDPNNLGIAAKIVSVEARHSAVVRNLLIGGTFATFADSTIIHPISLQVTSSSTSPDPYSGLEYWKLPSQILPAVNNYLTVNLTATSLA